jgi:hypothetical protein
LTLLLIRLAMVLSWRVKKPTDDLANFGYLAAPEFSNIVFGIVFLDKVCTISMEISRSNSIE